LVREVTRSTLALKTTLSADCSEHRLLLRTKKRRGVAAKQAQGVVAIKPANDAYMAAY
jgi:hypothetical protein